MFLASNGSVYACGTNTYGRLGDGSTTQRNTPVQVKNVGGNGFLSNISCWCFCCCLYFIVIN